MAELADLPTDPELGHAEREALESRTTFDRAQSQLEVFARELMDVAAAKEALVAAEGNCSRVRALDRTLDLTISFLEQAEGARPPYRRASARQDSAAVASQGSLAVGIRIAASTP